MILVHLKAIEDVAQYGHRGAVRETVWDTDTKRAKSHIVIPGETEVWATKKYVPPVGRVTNGSVIYDKWNRTGV